MIAKTLGLGIWSAVMALTLIGTTALMTAWAAAIICNSANDPCIGTDGGDTMIGDDGNNDIIGLAGNDVISAKDGHIDELSGDRGDDVLSGGPGRDVMFGGPGADRLVGGDGPDEISHGLDSADRTEPDGSKDVIDCGLGNFDEAWINVSVDHDTASGCETVHEG